VKAFIAQHGVVFVAALGNAGLCSSVPRKRCQSSAVSFAIVAKIVCKVVDSKLLTLDLFVPLQLSYLFDIIGSRLSVTCCATLLLLKEEHLVQIHMYMFIFL